MLLKLPQISVRRGKKLTPMKIEEPPSGFDMTRSANLNIGLQSPKPYLPRIDSSVSSMLRSITSLYM